MVSRNSFGSCGSPSASFNSRSDGRDRRRTCHRVSLSRGSSSNDPFPFRHRLDRSQVVAELRRILRHWSAPGSRCRPSCSPREGPRPRRTAWGRCRLVHRQGVVDRRKPIRTSNRRPIPFCPSFEPCAEADSAAGADQHGADHRRPSSPSGGTCNFGLRKIGFSSRGEAATRRTRRAAR